MTGLFLFFLFFRYYELSGSCGAVIRCFIHSIVHGLSCWVSKSIVYWRFNYKYLAYMQRYPFTIPHRTHRTGESILFLYIHDERGASWDDPFTISIRWAFLCYLNGVTVSRFLVYGCGKFSVQIMKRAIELIFDWKRFKRAVSDEQSLRCAFSLSLIGLIGRYWGYKFSLSFSFSFVDSQRNGVSITV